MIKEKIKKEINKNSVISFSKYMEIILFDEFGIYEKNSIFGKEGHFITSPLISEKFSQALANHYISFNKQFPLSSILELGGGDGTLACDLLAYLKKCNNLPKAYYFYERSKKLINHQKNFLHDKDFYQDVSFFWIESPEDVPKSSFIIANEFFDCLPIDIYKYHKKKFLKAVINANLIFDWIEASENEQDLFKLLDLPNDLPNDYFFELSKYQKTFIELLSSNIDKSEMVIIDYGYASSEMYIKDRMRGTIACIKNHISDFNPLEDIGEKDISSFVNFSFISNILKNNGWNNRGFLNQASYLLSFDILKDLNYNDYSEINSVKKLILPNHMGEIFKVLITSKNIKNPIMYNLFKNDIMKL